MADYFLHVNSGEIKNFCKQVNTWWSHKILLYFLSGIFQQFFGAVAFCHIIFPEIETPEGQRLLVVFKLLCEYEVGRVAYLQIWRWPLK